MVAVGVTGVVPGTAYWGVVATLAGKLKEFSSSTRNMIPLAPANV